MVIEENASIPVVILAGGLGTRLREETEFKPKPMVEIGERPIIWHIMKHYTQYGYRKFVICLGYKGEMILNYFLNYRAHGSTTRLHLKSDQMSMSFSGAESEEWEIFLCDTGKDSLTGDRLLKIREHIDTPYFHMTYGDGLSNVNLDNLVKFHKEHELVATLTAVHPANRFGTLEISNTGVVHAFLEKPLAHDWINGGFFVLSSEIFNLIKEGSFEEETLPVLSKSKNLAAYQHEGYWQCMDTYREYMELNRLWTKGAAPWTQSVK